eukprot:4812524-Amphidinium_carterae.1
MKPVVMLTEGNSSKREQSFGLHGHLLTFAGAAASDDIFAMSQMQHPNTQLPPSSFLSKPTRNYH